MVPWNDVVSITTDSPKITSKRSGIKSPSWSVTGDSVPSAKLGSVEDTGDCGRVWETNARLEKINIVTSKAVCFLRICPPLYKMPGSEIYHGDGASFGHMLIRRPGMSLMFQNSNY